MVVVYCRAMQVQYSSDQSEVCSQPGIGTSSQNLVPILVKAWVSYFLSLFLDILYYKLHPSAVDLSLKNKTSVYIFGVRRQVPFL